MRKYFLMWLFIFTAFFAISQGKTIYEVNVVKPKAGMKSAFEASWKLHLNKYHQSSDKRQVYEVTSGPHIGSYMIVEGPFSYADMDKTKPNTREHRLDLERNFTPKLEPGSQNFKAGRVDTLSHDANATATKFLVTITVVKDGKMGEYLTELRRMTILFDKFNGPYSYFNLIKYQAGSNPTIITIRLLKNGYKELEAGYFSYPPDTFRDTYVTEYGQQAWDKRVKLLVDDVVSQEEHFEEWRKDLSSKQ